MSLRRVRAATAAQAESQERGERRQFPLVSQAALCGLAAFAVAFVLNVALELIYNGDLVRLLGYNFQIAFRIFLLNTVLLWLVLILIQAFFNRFWVPAGLFIAVVLILGVVSRTKTTLRREPLYPSDAQFLTQPGFLIEMVGLPAVLAGVVVVLALPLAAWLVGRRLARRFPRIAPSATTHRWWVFLGIRGLVSAMAVAVLVSASQFNAPGNPVRGAYEAAGAQWAWWNQKVNVMRHGTPAALLYNLDVPPRQAPEGYSAEAIAEIAAKYAPRSTTTRMAATPEAPNIVLVLCENFSDPTLLDGVEFEGDPIPRTRDRMEATTSGQMLAQLLGGGTANVEFEVLTGLTLSEFQPQLNSPYQMLIPSQDYFPSVIGMLKQQGYTAGALHPYSGAFYQRDVVYRSMGFDWFSDLDDLEEAADLERLGDTEFASDASVFDQALRELDDADSPAVLNVVTMQNHHPNLGTYDDPWQVERPAGDTGEELGHYLRGIEHSDEALEDFLNELADFDEPTAVLFYGDHLPALWDDQTYSANGELRMRSTPFLIWSNTSDTKLETPRVLNATHFLPMLFEHLGLESPPYYRLLAALREHVPAMAQGALYDAAGERVDEASLSEEAREVLADYRMVHYDLSAGKRYAMTSMFDQTDPTTSAAPAP